MRPPSRPAVLLLHGQPGWGGVYAGVRRALDGVGALAPDRPGWGTNPAPAGGFATGARAARELLDEHGVERTLVVGHSWAAAVAVQLALEHPERVSGLVLLGPAIVPGAYGWVDRLLAARVAAPVLRGAFAAAAGALRAAPGSLLPAALDREVAAARLADPRSTASFLVEQRAALAEVGALAARLGEVPVDALLLSGARDLMVPTACVRVAARALPRARLLVVPRAGHLLPSRHPATVAAAIRASLAAAPGS